MQILQSLGPAVDRVSIRESIRAAFGAAIGLGVAGAFILSPEIDLELGLYLVAPFGASAVLLFAVPNSPLAQPWSAVVGNTTAAFVGVSTCLLIDDPVLRVATAVGLTILATLTMRAAHPPAGAVAMTAALTPDSIAHLGYWFVLSPIGLGTLTLVVLAIVYAHLTGRKYPFRQFNDPSEHHTNDRNPIERLGLSEEDLHSILNHYRQSFNIGTEDLARLIGAAEIKAAGNAIDPIYAKDIMSRDLITISPIANVSEIASVFHRHRFTSLPVVTQSKQYLGVIFQMHLLRPDAQTASADTSRTNSTLSRLLRRPINRDLKAVDIMDASCPVANEQTPISVLLQLFAEDEVDAVPVLRNGEPVGIVTHTDLVAAIARKVAKNHLFPTAPRP